MPPGNMRKKKAAKNKLSGGAVHNAANVDIPTVLDAYVHEVNSAEDWDAIGQILCRIFDLPDIDKRSGLKKLHAKFPEIQKKLDAAYAKYHDNEKVLGGVVCIWSWMCVDSIMRNRLVDAGVINKMVLLLDSRSTHIVGLEAISAIDHHGGVEVKREVAMHTPKFLQLMDQFPDDPRLHELTVSILYHSVSVVVSESPIQPQDLERLDISNALRLVIASVRNPSASLILLSHAFNFLAQCCTLNCSNKVMTFPAAVNLLITCLHSEEITIRACALGGLICLVFPDSDTSPMQQDPNKLKAILQSGVPAHLDAVLMNYGWQRCDTLLSMQCTIEFQQAMAKCLYDKDLLSLGRTLARLITTTEYSVAEGCFSSRDPRAGRGHPDSNIGLPFEMFSDALPACAIVLRKTGDPKDADLADILDLKFFMMRQRLPEAQEFAQRAITRNPQQAYFYYAYSLTENKAEGLKMCKKGLKCKQTTPFVTSYLRWRAVHHAGQLGIAALSLAAIGDSAYTEGIAFLTSALEDAKIFIAEAPPDNRNMEAVLSWQILLTLALRGNELNHNLQEFDSLLGKLKITKELVKLYSVKESKNNLDLARELIMSRHAVAWTEWHQVIKRYNMLTGCDNLQERAEDAAEDTLSTWLRGLHVEGEKCDHRGHPCGMADKLSLYRCSYCRNPSVALKKCSGCRKTMYCDASCQKMHWPEHKVACKAAQS